MSVYKVCGVTFLLASFALPAKAAGRELITTIQVAAAMRSAGLDVSADQVALLSDVVAKTNSPDLRVASVGAWVGESSRVRLDCGMSDECLPFIVTVRRNLGSKSMAAIPLPNQRAGERSTADTFKNKVAVRSGSMAVLLLDGAHIHIQLPVICLESGVVGQRIRVAGKGRERTYVAEVCSDGFLRGAL